MAARDRELRSPMVLRCLDDYLGKIRHSLDVVTHLTAILPAATARKKTAGR
jgi:hypothetical protein